MKRRPKSNPSDLLARVALAAVPWICALTVHRSPGIGEPVDSGPWLNVKNVGASGSEFSTNATTVAGTNQITVKDVGDFKVGQGVIVSKASIQYLRCLLRDGMYTSNPLGEAVQIRGYDGSGGGWMVFVLDVENTNPLSFRWSEDVGRTWKARGVSVTGDWQPLGAGVEVRFDKSFAWKVGHVITFDARDYLASTITKIEGNVVTLKDAANQTSGEAVLRHEDTAALQAAIQRAITEKRNLYLPAGYYRLLQGLEVDKPSGITIEGADGVNTVLDISLGLGPCLHLTGGTEVNLRNLRMTGHWGMADGIPNSFRTSGGYDIWRMHIKPCAAVNIAGTERVLVENVHANRMSCEAFYAQAPARWGKYEPPQYTKSITYLRCTVTDCGFNAFNNNDFSESTSILYCRVENIANCFWEGPGRFIRIVGNYARNTGTVAVGNLFHRYPEMYDLPHAQTIVADNVFEGPAVHPSAICVSYGATQVAIRNNLFINYPATAVQLSGAASQGFPPGRIVITGNIVDLTSDDGNAGQRTGIDVGCSDVTVSDNQMYVRGKSDAKVVGIRVREPALNLDVHDNLMRNCGTGLSAYRVQDVIAEVVDDRTFLCTGGALPLEWKTSHLYRGWNLVWLSNNQPTGVSVIDSFDADTLRFKLREARPMKTGERFEVYPPYGVNWNLHNNTITGCQNPVVLDAYGSETSVLKDNIITRGDTTGVKQAVEVRGRFNLLGNRFSGFDEAGSSVLMLQPDRLGRPCRNVVRDNIFENCNNVAGESEKGLWQACSAEGNLFVNCGQAPK